MRRTQTITSDVFDHLLGLMRSRAVSPGERLPTEKDLVAEFGVSRTCVREAIKSLEALQIVVVRPRSGAVVCKPAAGALFNAELFSTAVGSHRADILLEFRRVVEGGLATSAAEKARPEDLEAIGRRIRDYEVCLKSNVLPYEADIAFHAAIAAASQNPLGQMVLEGMQVLSRNR
jgi:DNA-binding FadR family transcriptional regulator